MEASLSTEHDCPVTGQLCELVCGFPRTGNCKLLEDNMTAQQLFRQIRESSSESFWLKTAVLAADDRDCLDALYDAETLLEFCRLRASEVTGQAII